MEHSISGDEVTREIRLPRANILVIDDNPEHLTVMTRLLGDDYVVKTCLSPVDAVIMLTGGEHVDAVICDYQMPDQTGIEVHQSVATTAPEVACRFIMLSGSVGDSTLIKYVVKHKIPLLEKPVAKQELRDAIAAVIAEHSDDP